MTRSASFNLFSFAQAFLRCYLATRSGKGLANPDIWHAVDDHDALMADANAAINPAWFMFLRSEPGNPNSCGEQNGGDRLSFVSENFSSIYFDFEPSASPCLYLYSSIWHHTVALSMQVLIKLTDQITRHFPRSSDDTVYDLDALPDFSPFPKD
jgi:hypothetical protein